MNLFFSYQEKCSRFFQRYTFDNVERLSGNCTDNHYHSAPKGARNDDMYEEYFEKIYIRSIKTILSYQMIDYYDEPEFDYTPIYSYVSKHVNPLYKNRVMNICLTSFQKRYSLSFSKDVIHNILFYLID